MTTDQDPALDQARGRLVELGKQRKKAIEAYESKRPSREDLVEAIEECVAAGLTDVTQIAQLSNINRQQLYRDADFRDALGLPVRQTATS